jgi:tRNA(Ile)-lysidine synthase
VLKQFQKHLDKNFPFLKKSNILIASSGGIDSTVLAHLFHLSELNCSLAHCNFSLRAKESDLDETFVKNLGSFLNFSVFTTTLNTKKYASEKGISIQMAARELRYDWFEKTAKKHQLSHILTGHHKDDVLETVLINFTRGTGLDGLTGIPEINGKVVRPLLPFSREEIQKYAEKNKIIWREDESNSSTKYFRNKIRHEIVPILKELNSNFLHSFDTTLNNLKESQVIIKDRVESLRKHVISYNENGIHSISIKKIEELKSPKANLYEILKPYGFTNSKDTTRLLKAQSGKQLFSKTHRLLKNRDELLLSTLQKNTEDTFLVPENAKNISKPISLIFTEVDSIGQFSSTTAYIDKKKLNNTFVVRKWQKGDYFYPIGMNGKKKLSNYFKDQKLSLLEKEETWLLCDGNDIVWVVGKRMDDRYKISKNTKTILEIKYSNVSNSK